MVLSWQKHCWISLASMVAEVWTGDRFSNLKNIWTVLQIQKFWTGAESESENVNLEFLLHGWNETDCHILRSRCRPEFEKLSPSSTIVLKLLKFEVKFQMKSKKLTKQRFLATKCRNLFLLTQCKSGSDLEFLMRCTVWIDPVSKNFVIIRFQFNPCSVPCSSQLPGGRGRGFVAIGNPERHVRKASHRGSKQQYRSPDEITLLLLVRAAYIYCCSSRTSRSWWITQSTQYHRRGYNMFRPEVASDSEWRSRLRQDSAFFFLTRSQKHVKIRTRSHFSISAVTGVCVVMSEVKPLVIFGYLVCSRSLNRSRFLKFEKLPDPDSKILEQERNQFWKSDFGHLKFIQARVANLLIRDERIVKFFSPSPVLIRWNWIRSIPELKNFWKSSVRSSPDPQI